MGAVVTMLIPPDRASEPMQGHADDVLVRVFAGDVVIASLATEIFPKAYLRDHHMARLSTARPDDGVTAVRSAAGQTRPAQCAGC